MVRQQWNKTTTGFHLNTCLSILYVHEEELGIKLSYLVDTNTAMLFCIYTRRQHQCIQTETLPPKQTTQEHSTKMAAASVSVFPVFVSFLLVVSSLSPVMSISIPIVSDSGHRTPANQTFRPVKHMQKLKRVNAYLKKINKPAVKTIQVFFFFFFCLCWCSFA